MADELPEFYRQAQRIGEWQAERRQQWLTSTEDSLVDTCPSE